MSRSVRRGEAAILERIGCTEGILNLEANYSLYLCSADALHPLPRVGPRGIERGKPITSIEQLVGNQQRSHEEQTVFADLSELTDQLFNFISDVVGKSEQALFLAVFTAQAIGAPIQGDRDLPHPPFRQLRELPPRANQFSRSRTL